MTHGRDNRCRRQTPEQQHENAGGQDVARQKLAPAPAIDSPASAVR